MRTDVHRPSAINPGDYVLTGNVFDLKYDDLETMEVGTKPYGHCNHCGKAIRWAVEFRHLPSATVVVFGEICADVLQLSDSRTKHELTLLKRRVANLEKKLKYQRERDENYAEFKARNPEVAEWFEEMGEKTNIHFLKSLKWSLDKWGTLSQNQINAFNRVLEQEAEKLAKIAARPVPTEAVREGRYLMTGEIIKVKTQYSDYYGDTLKMTVVLGDGNKVWGTVPASIAQDAEKGKKVTFYATVTKSKDDDHFGFFKRPTGATVE